MTVELPDDLYARLQRRAVESQRSIEVELVQLLSKAVPEDDDRLPSELEQELARVQELDDGALWELARAQFSTRTAQRMQSLQFKRQREGLSVDERRLEEALAREYDRHMLVRSKALLLLKQRGHNVDELVSRS